MPLLAALVVVRVAGVPAPRKALQEEELAEPPQAVALTEAELQEQGHLAELWEAHQILQESS